MANMVNFGIDLGTTNSLIARFNKGVVEIFKNPIGQKETLPSVVGFRRGRILIGDNARTYAEKDPRNVVSRFKRRMGTTESFPIESIQQSKTPVDLSAEVLKELKTFVYSGEPVGAAVITVPASFDNMQSNATKEAGERAGFKQVVLLQEPIAASLAYANSKKGNDTIKGQWLVYDLGGGTFDVALVKTVEGELKIVDHEGDNFLGGTDFDADIVDHLVVPRLRDEGDFGELAHELKGASGRHAYLWQTLLHKAEAAKVLLSNRSSAEIEIEATDLSDAHIEAVVTITRSEFEALIKPHIDRTAEMIKTMLARNSLRPTDLKFVLLVGGSTFIPFVRQRIGELLGIPVSHDIDPITAVAVGAAYFAATKTRESGDKQPSLGTKGGPTVRLTYDRITRHNEALLAGRVEGTTTDLFYRVTRDDGGFDSGVKALTFRINEDLPLVPDEYNTFTFRILDSQHNALDLGIAPIEIAHGYAPSGQVVPHDISLVVDDPEFNRMKLEPLFLKNTILPGKTRKVVATNRTVIRGCEDDVIRIMVTEGPSEALPAATLRVGELTITGKQLMVDLFRGSDIELEVEMTESRDIRVSAHIPAIGQDFKQVFTPARREVNVDTLKHEIRSLNKSLEAELAEAEERENFAVAAALKPLRKEAQDLDDDSVVIDTEDSTDERYKLEDRKNKLARKIDGLTKGKLVDRRRAEYYDVKESCGQVVADNGNDREKRSFEQMISTEAAVVASGSPRKIEAAIDSLRQLRFQILRRTPVFLTEWFEWLASQRQRLNDQTQAKSLIEAGKLAVSQERFDSLEEINFALGALLPDDQRQEVQQRYDCYAGFGLR